MAWINYFFDGFLIVKVPFPLTPRFKMMLQQGIDLKSLSASYVSSLSWYFIVMFGINGFYSLILGQKVDAGEEMMKAQMGMMGGGPQQFDAKKAFIGERDAVRMMQHVDVAAFSERTLVGMDTDVLGDGHSHGGKPCSSTHGKKGIEAAGGKSGKSGEKAGLRQRKGKTAA